MTLAIACCLSSTLAGADVAAKEPAPHQEALVAQWSGITSRIAATTHQRIRTQKAWQACWADHYERLDGCPTIDFEQFEVVAMTCGDAEYGVTSVGMVATADGCELHYAFGGGQSAYLLPPGAAEAPRPHGNTFGLFLIRRQHGAIHLAHDERRLLADPHRWQRDAELPEG